MQLRKLTVVFATTALGLLAFACTIETTPGGGGGSSGSNNDDNSDSGSSTSSDASTSDGGSTEVDVEECKKAPDLETCDTCCGFTEEVARPYDEPYFTCLCEEKCQAECGATFCSEEGSEPDATCEACLNANDDACSAKGEAECEKDAKCKAYLACIEEACVEVDGGR